MAPSTVAQPSTGIVTVTVVTVHPPLRRQGLELSTLWQRRAQLGHITHSTDFISCSSRKECDVCLRRDGPNMTEPMCDTLQGVNKSSC
ncbi:hypothetical protein BDZ89DRAFT_1060778 [Hymenopellis radicata]|nr:hypothetical protein BDZ89DRAFT_1060778 [Hymenopellis radicata]